MSYINIEEFRDRTGLTLTDINDTLLQTYLNRATEKIRDECYILRRREMVGKTTVSNGSVRYYFNNLYLADSNLDGDVDKTDLEVLERNNDGTVENDITSQISSIDQYEGYFTLNSGYPTNGSYNVYVTYRWTRFPIAEIEDELEELCMAMAMNYYNIYQVGNVFKRGVTNISIPGMSVTRGYDAFENMSKSYKQIEKDILSKLKPIRMLAWKGNTGATQYPNSQSNPVRRDNLYSNNTINEKVSRYGSGL